MIIVGLFMAVQVGELIGLVVNQYQDAIFWTKQFF
jgi:hypothetical protein